MKYLSAVKEDQKLNFHNVLSNRRTEDFGHLYYPEVPSQQQPKGNKNIKKYRLNQII